MTIYHLVDGRTGLTVCGLSPNRRQPPPEEAPPCHFCRIWEDD